MYQNKLGEEKVAATVGPSDICIELSELPSCKFHFVLTKYWPLHACFQGVLEAYSFTVEKQEMIQQVIQERVDVLTEEHVCLAFNTRRWLNLNMFLSSSQIS